MEHTPVRPAKTCPVPCFQQKIAALYVELTKDKHTIYGIFSLAFAYFDGILMTYNYIFFKSTRI